MVLKLLKIAVGLLLAKNHSATSCRTRTLEKWINCVRCPSSEFGFTRAFTIHLIQYTPVCKPDGSSDSRTDPLMKSAGQYQNILLVHALSEPQPIIITRYLFYVRMPCLLPQIGNLKTTLWKNNS